VSRKVAFRWNGRSLEGSLAIQGRHATWTREGRTLDATVAREGAWVEVVMPEGTARCAVNAGSREVWVSCRGRTYVLERAHRTSAGPAAETSTDEIRAPMTGRVVRVDAHPGARVAEGDLLLTIEAMKMEFRLTAPEDGQVDEVHCADGDQVELGQVLVRLTPASAEASAGGAP
jgi:biotin carboxyl carrier protein